MPNTIDWTTLLMHVSNAKGDARPAYEAQLALFAFRDRGIRPEYGWTRCGLGHEDPSRPETWGPRSPADVIWVGMQP